MTSDRVHKEIEEARRLAAVVRAALGKNRELSRFGRDELRQVHGSLGRSLETARDSAHPAVNRKGA